MFNIAKTSYLMQFSAENANNTHQYCKSRQHGERFVEKWFSLCSKLSSFYTDSLCCDFGDTCNICCYLWFVIDVMSYIRSLCNICLKNKDYVSNNQYSVKFSSTFFRLVLFWGFWFLGFFYQSPSLDRKQIVCLLQ